MGIQSTCIGSLNRGGSDHDAGRALLVLSFFFLAGELVAAFLFHALEHFRHVFDRVENLGGNVNGALLLDGQRNAVAALRKSISGRIFLGGHSYGGRQAAMLCAAEPDLVSGLLLLSYPLHPPRKPEQLRIQHLPNLRTQSLFVHGTRDPFGSIEEIKKALALIPAKNELLEVEGAGHDLNFKGKTQRKDLPEQVVLKALEFFEDGMG